MDAPFRSSLVRILYSDDLRKLLLMCRFMTNISGICNLWPCVIKLVFARKQ